MNHIFVNGFLLLQGAPNNNLILYHKQSMNIYCIDYASPAYSSILRTFQNKYSEDSRNIFADLNHLVESSPKSIRVDYSKLPESYQIILPISSNCNLQCPYCFARTSGKFQFESYNSQEIRKVIDYFHNESSCGKVTYAFFGGEPFLKFDIIKFAVKYALNTYPTDTISFSITTNGTIFNEDYACFLRENNISLLISIDGPDNEYNYRKYADGTCSVNNVLNNIKKYIKWGVNINLRATVTKDYHGLPQLFDFFEDTELPFDVEFAYKSANNDTDLSNYSDADLSHIESEFDALIKYYFQRIEENKNIHNSFLIKALATLKYRMSRTNNCSGGMSMFSVTNNGNVFSCEHLIHDDQFSIGNIYNDSVSQLQRKQSSPRIDKLSSSCKDCPIVNLCVGGCFSQKMLVGKKITDCLSEDDCKIQFLKWSSIIMLYSLIQQHHSCFIESLTEKDL